MTPTEINGIILTDDCISSIKTIQEGEHSWMEATLEKQLTWLLISTLQILILLID